MSKRAHGQVRRGQIVTTYGPGALIDLPRHSAISGGLETWPGVNHLEEVVEPRLSRKLEYLTGVKQPRLYAPPAADSDPRKKLLGVAAYRFPEWFLVQEERGTTHKETSRRLVRASALDTKRKFDGRPVVATRFVRACPHGHVDDIDWRAFAHGGETLCRRQLWIDEKGTSGDLIDLRVRCECGKSEGMYKAVQIELNALGTCPGRRPWLGNVPPEPCDQPSRLLIRTASNAYFPHVVGVLALPDHASEVEKAVREVWAYLDIVDDLADLTLMKRKPAVTAALAPFSDEDVLRAIKTIKSGGAETRPVKLVELEAILAAPEGYGDDVPIDPDFHARRLPASAWRSTESSVSSGILAVIQLHRLREVLALFGFSRFESVTPDIHGEFDDETDATRAQIADDPTWFPAVENRGEGVFLLFDPEAVRAWLARDAVKKRIEVLRQGHEKWLEGRKLKRAFPAGPYVMAHTLAHLLIQSLSMRCGYPASSIRERIYFDRDGSGTCGLLLYTGSSDAEGTLGGLVQQARHIESHLAHALRSASLCSNDPICAQHSPGETMENRLLHGAACHACALVAETSCEMRNDYLDRALVVPTLANPDAAFFGSVG